MGNIRNKKKPAPDIKPNPVGRPPFYKTPEELQEKIDLYFKNLPMATKYFAMGQEIQVPCPTITGLTLFLGFCDRQSFYAYEENKPEFSYTLKKARTFIEKHYEEMLQNGNTTGAIFALKNFNWKDKQEVDQNNTNLNIAADKENLTELKALIRKARESKENE